MLDERAEEQLIAERDRFSDALTDTHVALGGDGEWIAKPGSVCGAGETGDLALDVPAIAREAMLRIEYLESLLPQAFDAGVAYGIASHRDFKQVHPDRDAWVREALGKDEETR